MRQQRIDGVEDGQQGQRIELGPTETSGAEVGETGVVSYLGDAPLRELRSIAASPESPAGVPLSCVVARRRRIETLGRPPLDGVFQTERLVMKAAENELAQQPHRRLEQHDASTRDQNPGKLTQCLAGILEMAPYVEQDQIANGRVGKSQAIRV